MKERARFIAPNNSCSIIKDTHRRRSLRLKNFDYAAAGAYFVTICAHQRACIFGQTEAGIMQPSDAGEMIAAGWQEIPIHYTTIEMDEFVVMPNHIHGIIFINSCCAEAVPKSDALVIGEIIRAFKARCTRALHQIEVAHNAQIWQRNYYEHIIRNEKELSSIREYITNNPLQWDLDAENPQGKISAGRDESRPYT